MNSDRDKNPESHNGLRFARAAGALATVILLAGCSAVPDWANPVEWVDGGSSDAKAESKADGGEKQAEKTPGDGKDFPNLASVPERPKAPTEEERKRLAESLNADRENAKYSDEVIKRQSAAAIPPPPPAPAAPSENPAAAAPKPGVSAPVPPTPPAPAARPATPPPPPLPGAQATSPLPSGSVLSRAPVSRPPQFDAPPPSPVVPAAGPGSVAPRAVPPSPNVRSVARVGNPSFGAPPSDIAAALGAGTSRSATAQFAPQPQVPGTASSGVALANGGAPAAMVRFKAGSAQLTGATRQQVRQVVGMFRERGGAIRVEGHASSRTRNMDPVQHHLVNFNVSLNRANAVANELIRQGVPPESVFVAAMSDSQPLFYEVMPAGDAGNQRVEIHFVN